MDLKHTLTVASAICFALGGLLVVTGFVLLFRQRASRVRIAVLPKPARSEVRSFRLAA